MYAARGRHFNAFQRKSFLTDRGIPNQSQQKKGCGAPYAAEYSYEWSSC